MKPHLAAIWADCERYRQIIRDSFNKAVLDNDMK